MAIDTSSLDSAQTVLQQGKQAHQKGQVAAAEDCYVRVLAALGVELPTELLASSGPAPLQPLKVSASAEAAEALHLLGAARAQRALQQLRRRGGGGGAGEEDDEDEAAYSKEGEPVNVELEAALCLLRAALAAEPEGDKLTRRARLRNSLGAGLLQLRTAEATQRASMLFRLAIEMDSTCWSARPNLLKALRALGREADLSNDAAAVRSIALERVGLLREMAKERPDYPLVFYKLGMELKSLGGHDEEAAGALEKHLEVFERDSDPAAAVNNASSRDQWKAATARHWLAVIRGENSATAPPAYVASLFDSYADRFEEHLVQKLGYKTPQLIAAELPRGGFGRCADLGCGTGLMGPELRTLGARELEGVDLSEGMLMKARSKGARGVGYDRLICGDLLAIFRARAVASDAQDVAPPIEHLKVPEEGVPDPESDADRFDLVVAADVFVYIGDLEPAISAAARWLNVGGLLVFSVESPPQGQGAAAGFALTGTGRYVHSVAYVGRTAETCGFSLAVRRAATLRYNAGEPVRGHIYVFRLGGGGGGSDGSLAPQT